MLKRLVNPDSAPGAFAWYTLLACVLTWPLVRHVATGIPQDLGDPLLNVWILGWDLSHLSRLLGGHLDALRGFWNANIFYPEPLTLAYSEHLVAQAIEAMPVYLLTGNLILCYNLLFLSTFVLSGLGVFLLVRELTGHGRAGFLAGLLYAFALFRAAHFGQLQVLSSQWMPLALFGFRRYFVTRRRRALAGAALALVAQNLSCGYYLLFFTPFVAAYVLYEVVARRLVRDVHVWVSLAAAGAGVTLVTLPFLLPYQALHASGVLHRGPGDVAQFSADVYGYLSAAPKLLVWSRLHMIYKGENALFFGIVPIALGIAGAAVVGVRAWRTAAQRVPDLPRPDRSLLRALSVLVAAAALAGIAVMLAGRGVVGLKRVDPLLGLAPTYFAIAIAGLAVMLASTPRTRALWAGGEHHSTGGFYVAATLAAIWLSFGPLVCSGGYPVSHATVYGWLYAHVPGFDGLRCPARYAMLAALFAAVLAGFAADAIARSGRVARLAVLGLAAAFVVEAAPDATAMHAVWPGRDASLPAALDAGAERMYRYVNSLPADAVLAELPFAGEPGVNTAYMYGSTLHWRRLVNGHSGLWPDSYTRRENDLRHPLDNRDRAWSALIGSGATHAIVHERLFAPGEGEPVSDWLRQSGARMVLRSGTDRLFALPGKP